MVFIKAQTQLCKKCKENTKKHTSTLQDHVHSVHIYTVFDIENVKPFICLSWSQQPQSAPLIVHSYRSDFIFVPQLSNYCIYFTAPSCLQTHSQGTQLSHKESKSSHTPFPALYVISHFFFFFFQLSPFNFLL